MESEQTKRLAVRWEEIKAGWWTPNLSNLHLEAQELSRRLDALEHKPSTKPVNSHYVGCPAALWISAAIDAAVKEARAERDREWSGWGFIEVAIRNPSVSEYMDHWEKRAEKAEAEVKRLSDPRWITHMSCHNSTYAAFARHVKGGGS